MNARHWQMDPRFMQFMHARGMKAAGLDPDTIDEFIAKDVARYLNVEPYPLTMTDDGIGIIRVKGPLYKDRSIFETNYKALLDAIEAAGKEAAAVVLQIDSPGGMVAGLQQVIAAVDELAGNVLTVAVVDGMCASAAYRIASRCGAIFAQPESEIGSIGTYWQLIDYSEAFEQDGLKSVLLTTGPFKGTGAIGEPITDEQRAFMQLRTDEYNQFMLADVQSGRELTDEQLAAVSDGRWWLAAEAADLGLIDGIGSLQDVLSRIRSHIHGEGAADMAKQKLQAVDDSAAESKTPEPTPEPVEQETAPAAAAEQSAPAGRDLSDYMQAFGDAEGARMFVDGTSWDDAQDQHRQQLEGTIQDLKAENAQLKDQLKQMAEGEATPVAVTNTEDSSKAVSFSEACRGRKA